MPPGFSIAGLNVYSAGAWLCAVSPLLVCQSILGLAMVFWAGMDGGLARFLEGTMLLAYFFAMFIAPAGWIVLILVRRSRLSAETLLMQICVFVAGWLLTFPSLVLLESQNSPGWFLD